MSLLTFLIFWKRYFVESHLRCKIIFCTNFLMKSPERWENLHRIFKVGLYNVSVLLLDIQLSRKESWDPWHINFCDGLKPGQRSLSAYTLVSFLCSIIWVKRYICTYLLVDIGESVFFVRFFNKCVIFSFFFYPNVNYVILCNETDIWQILILYM